MKKIIDKVRVCVKKCVQQYFAERKRPNPPFLIFFDKNNKSTNINDLKGQEDFIDTHCHSGHGT
jgi:hypothetical protein